MSTLGESHAALNTDRDRSKDGLLLFQGTRKLGCTRVVAKGHCLVRRRPERTDTNVLQGKIV